MPDLRRHAEHMGLDMAHFDACIQTGETKPKIARDMEDGASNGVSGTPTIFVNGRMIDGVPEQDKLARAIEEELRLRGARVLQAPAGSPFGGELAR